MPGAVRFHESGGALVSFPYLEEEPLRRYYPMAANA
jgi:hypothetical protein